MIFCSGMRYRKNSSVGYTSVKGDNIEYLNKNRKSLLVTNSPFVYNKSKSRLMRVETNDETNQQSHMIQAVTYNRKR